MRAIGYQETGSIERADALVDIDLPKPEAKGRDILVAIKAVSVNPVDTKVRVRSKPEAGAWRVGWMPPAWSRLSARMRPSSSRAMTCSMPVPSAGRAPMPSFIWLMSGSSGASQNPLAGLRRPRCR